MKAESTATVIAAPPGALDTRAPSAVREAGRLTVAEKVAYGLGDTASNVVFQMVILFLPMFYTDVYGISAAAMGWLFLVVRIFDALTDPLMGALCDRTQTRWGKFRPYLAAISVPFGVVTILSFVTPPFSMEWKLAYAFATYLLLMTAYTAINIPYCALGGVMTANSQERVELNSYRFALSSLACILIASCTLPLVEKFGQGDPQKGFPMAVAFFAFLAVLLFFACFAWTHERVTGEAPIGDRSPLGRDLKLLLQNDQWRIVAAANFLLLIAIIMRGGAAAYYINWYADLRWFPGESQMITALHTSGAIAMIVGAPFAAVVTRRLGSPLAYSLIHAVIGLISIAMYWIMPHATLPLFVGYATIAFFTQMGNPVLWAMLADTVDYGEAKTGRRLTGLSFAGALFSLKVGMALGGALLGWVLAFYGYNGSAESQSPSAVTGILLTFTVLPGLTHLALAALVTQYRAHPLVESNLQ